MQQFVVTSPMSGADRPGWIWRFAALAWLCVVLAVGWHQWGFWQQGRVDTDVMALLPHDEQWPEVQVATRTLVDGLSRQVILLVGGQDWQQVQQASRLIHEQLHAADTGLQPQSPADKVSMDRALDFYLPWRDRLLTHAQRQMLQNTDAAPLAQRALMALYQPAAQARLAEWRADPLGLWTQWWSARAAQSQARPRDGMLWLQSEGLHWSVLSYEVGGSAFSFSGQAQLGSALDRVSAQVQQQWPGMQMLRAGMPLHAEAAAVQAHGEVNTIGWGSLAGVLLLAWLAFRSLRPMVLVGVSLVIGTAVALSVTAWWFGQVHLLTLVFGASLVGVAEDYGIHYFAARQGHAQTPPFRMMRRLMPSLWLALGTSVIAYLALGAAAFPGLRQMALFSVVGLAAALLTVLCWFPWLDRGRVRENRFAQRLGSTLQLWPRWPMSQKAWMVYGLVSVAAVLWLYGALPVQDDVRQLQNSPPQLIAQQVRIGKMLGLPSPTQFYLVRGNSEQQVLQREEALKLQLQHLVQANAIAGWSAVSDWVPSHALQQADAALVAARELAVLQSINQSLGEHMQRPAFSAEPLSLHQWLAQPVAAATKNLWVGAVGTEWMSVVMLRGVTDRSVLPQLQAAAQGIAGVRWVDKPQEISGLLQRYRNSMTWLLLLGHALVLAALCAYFGKQAWRAWVPRLRASLGSCLAC